MSSLNSRICLKTLCVLVLGCACVPLFGTTWYVRPDGGTRYSTNVTKGQCDGKADAPYPGSGANKHCAFNDVRMLYTDGTYADGHHFPAWGWVIAGGDTVIIRGSIGTGASYRIGWNGTTYDGWGIAGDASSSGMLPPPSGTAAQHTRILGENYASCHSASAKTQLHGGRGAYAVMSLYGASYVDVACLDITDFSACGKAAQKVGCDSTQDYAQVGIQLHNTSTHDTLTDIHIHGLAGSGIVGATGNGVVMDYVDVLGNASSGWNADEGDGTTGVGSLNVSHYDISWNGCAEEYPIVHPLPFGDCTDQDHGGYGDGFGTATKDSDPPGWQVHFDQGVVSYNTQDGLDALHIGGTGSSMTVTNTRAFSSMGQQIKVGGAAAIITDNLIVGNCRAMSKAIPGTPPGFNAQLSLFCRAGDSAIVVNVPETQPAIFQRNIIYSANRLALEVEYLGNPSPKAAIKYDDNIFIGFPNVEGSYPSPIYSNTDLKMFTNPGASFSNNITFRAKSNWKCPATWLHETGGSCSDPQLKDETWHEYGYGDFSRTKAIDKNSSQPEPGPSRGPSHVSTVMKSLGTAVLVAGAWRGFLYLRDRSTKA
ncbi:hypothetical protein EDE15_3079 [Edaphobacter aggregans]|uniref:Parallel beta helix pectate lyase-like protein n=1 Tax=Edaphobacter aggregans TaxID=570835 RepID=A0A3R9WHV2_9BACT|nr:hypothetical protein [Edaphobacter aggregans]RSL17544.1 hypothetical protein EDE15_3079 [Edaphobacter aggregans]